MSVLFLVIPLALLASAAAAFAFGWAIGRGEFDDLTTPAYRMLEDDDVSSAREGDTVVSARPVTTSRSGTGADDQRRGGDE